jgi:hypothetical protein
LAVVGGGWRPAAAALDSGHVDDVGWAVGGVVAGVVVATGAGPLPALVLDASGQRAAPW